jgi:hypothetical protein
VIISAEEYATAAMIITATGISAISNLVRILKFANRSMAVLHP